MYVRPLRRASPFRIMAGHVSRTLLVALLLSASFGARLASGQPADGSSARPEPRGGSAAAVRERQPVTPPEPSHERGLGELEDWFVLEEEDAPEPPLLRLEVGVLAFVESRTEMRSFKGGARGSELRDLEQQQGLDEGFVAPWLELSIGSKVRGGADAFFFVRGGENTIQDETLVFDGEVVATPGYPARPRFSLVSVSGFVAWDALYGRTYRLGLLGGLRYFRLDAAFTGVLDGVETTHRARGELLSPFFGGSFHLTPFPYLTVSSRVQFMNWSWRAVGLREARYFDFRLGAQINVVPGALGVALEYRFLVIQAEARERGDPGLDAAMAAHGLSLALVFTY